MKYYMSDGEAMYQDKNHGLFSKRLAKWAIENMEVKDSVAKAIVPLKSKSIEEVEEILKENKVEIQDEFMYTAWYLYNMSLADYPKSLKTDEQRANFVEETLFDPDGAPESVLACFVAKMCIAEIPIHWEKYL